MSSKHVLKNNIMKKIFLFIITLCLISACGGSGSKSHTEPTENRKAKWITEALTAIQSNTYPRIKGIAWWHENFDEAKLRLDSSQESIDAFTQGISAPFFKSTLTFKQNKLEVPQDGVYLGAFPDFGGEESLVSEHRIHSFESLIGKQIAWAYFSDNWLDNLSFPYDEVTVIHDAGRVPFIRMMARSDFEEAGQDPVYTLQRIIEGEFDAQLNAWATEAKNMPYPLLVEFGTEVNGNWFPWNGAHNGAGIKDGYGNPALADGPERFRDAYRHIITLFRKNKVKNITWFYHVDVHSEPDVDWNSIQNYYPGDDYIDWLGVSVYGPQLPDETYQSFTAMLDEFYPELIKLSEKPIAVLEFAITELP
jgi:hypothetical protein